jgi:hypothetical protein
VIAGKKEREATVATATLANKKMPLAVTSAKRSPIPRALRERAEALLAENYAFMDSPLFRRKNVETELFTEDAEAALPLTSWYQPTRDDAFENGLTAGAG